MTSTCAATAAAHTAAKRTLDVQAANQHAQSVAADAAAASKHADAVTVTPPAVSGSSASVQSAILGLKHGGA